MDSNHELADATMWWHGPAFLLNDEDQWPNGDFNHLGGEVPGRRETIAVVVVSKQLIVKDLLKRHSTLSRVCRIIAYCLRFRKAYRLNILTEFVSHEEVSRALEIVCKSVQRIVFSSEYAQLAKGGSINKSSRLLSLSPFMTKDGLI